MASLLTMLASAQVARRRQRRRRVGDLRAASSRRRPPVAEAPADPLGDEVRNQADHEQDHAAVEEGGLVQFGERAGELVGDARRQGVAGLEQDAWISEPAPITCETAIASPRARPRPSSEAAITPEAVVGRITPRTTSHRVAAQRRCSVLEVTRHGDWKRSREIEAMIGITMIVRIRLAVKTLAPVVSRGAEDRDEAEGVVQERLDVRLDERGKDDDPPEAEDDARDRRQHLDQGPDHSTHAGGGKQTEEEPDRDRDRCTQAPARKTS